MVSSSGTPQPTAAELSKLKALVNDTVAALQALGGGLKKPKTTYINASSAQPDFKSQCDALRLVDARCTQLTFMITNKPFTPSAIEKLVAEISKLAPFLAMCAMDCPTASYSIAFCKRIVSSTAAYLFGVSSVMSCTPFDGQELTGEKREEAISKAARARNSFDDLVSFLEGGPARCVRQSLESTHSSLIDTQEELKGWVEESNEELLSSGEDPKYVTATEDDESGDEDDSESSENEDDALDILDGLSEATIPAGDPKRLRPRLEFVQKRLKLTELMLGALLKRRVPNIPAPPYTLEVAKRIDSIINEADKISENTDAMAMGFYSMSRSEIEMQLGYSIQAAVELAQYAVAGFPGTEGEDKFSPWFARAKEELWKEGEFPFEREPRNST